MRDTLVAEGIMQTAAERGTRLYSEGDASGAEAAWTEALSDLQDQADVARIYANRKLNRLLHIGIACDNSRICPCKTGAAARLRLEKFLLAVHDAELSLTLMPSEWRPRLRLAKALGELNRIVDATREAQHVRQYTARTRHLLRRAAQVCSHMCWDSSG